MRHSVSSSSPRRRRPRGRAIAVGAALTSLAFGGSTLAASPARTLEARATIEALYPIDAAFASLERRSPAAAALVTRISEHQTPATPASAPVDFAIPAASLRDVLKAFEAASGVTVQLAVDSIGTLTSPGVSGHLSAPAALDALLKDTSVRARWISATVVRLELTVSESVSVVAETPVSVASAKYPTSLHQVPQTIEVVSRDVMDEQGATTLTDALRNVPGITLQAGEGGGASRTAGDSFNLRGFSVNNSIFVDGVRDDGLIGRDMFNIEQVEVFMGPTGSDVGRSTAGGYVNLVTKTPHAAPAYVGQYSVGDAGQNRVTFDVNQPLSLRPSTWWSRSAIRVNGLWQDSGVPGRNEVSRGSRGLAPSLSLGLGTATRVTIAEQSLRQNNVPDYGIPGAAWSAEPLAPTTVLAAHPVDQHNYYGSPAVDYDHARDDAGTIRVEHDLASNLTIRNQTAYNRTSREAVITSIQSPASFDPSTELVTLSRQGNEQRNSILSNQTNATAQFSTGRARHAASAGLELSSEELYTPTMTGVGTRAPVSIYQPNPDDPVIGYAPSLTGAFSLGRTATAALYGFDTVNLGMKWQVNGGARWEHYDTTFLAVDATGAATTDAAARDGLWSGKAGVVFRLSSAGNAYAAVGTTATPPGTANFTLSAQANNQNNPNVKPQRSTNVEAGTKWDLAGGRAAITAALFHTVNANVIYTVDATATPPIFNQDDGQRINGATVGVTGHPLRAWQIFANITYLDSHLETQSAANDGKRLTLTPTFSGSVWTTYQISQRLSLGGGVRSTGLVYVNAANTIISPGYRVVDGFAEYGVNRHLTLRLNIYNASDALYIASVNNNGGRYNPGVPRSFQVTTVVKY